MLQNDYNEIKALRDEILDSYIENAATADSVKDALAITREVLESSLGTTINSDLLKEKGIELSEKEYMEFGQAFMVMNEIMDYSVELRDIKENRLEEEIEKLVDEKIANGASMEDIVYNFNNTDIISATTMHPTYILTPDFTRALNSAMDALKDVALASPEEKTAALESFANAVKGTNFNAEKAVREDNFTTREEGHLGRIPLRNMIKGSQELAATIDKVMIKKFGDEYNPEELRLNKTREKNWINFDKDGNRNITAEVTEDTIIRERSRTIREFNKQLSNISELAKDDSEVRQSVNAAKVALTDFREKYATPDDNVQLAKKPSPDMDFQQEIANTIQTVRDNLQAIYASQDDKQSDIAKEAIALDRSVEKYGLAGRKAEYRDDKKFWKDVIDQVVSKELLEDILGKDELGDRHSYKALSNDEKKQVITTLFADEQTRSESESQLVQEFDIQKVFKDRLNEVTTIPGISDAGFDQDKNIGKEKIFYHTVKRLELAATHSDLVQSHVNAEEGTPERDGKTGEIYSDGALDAFELHFLLAGQGIENQIEKIELVESPEGLENRAAATAEKMANKAFYQAQAEVSIRKLETENPALFEMINAPIEKSAFEALKLSKGEQAVVDIDAKENTPIIDRIRALDPSKDDFGTKLSEIDRLIVRQSEVTDGIPLLRGTKSVLNYVGQTAQSDNTRRASPAAAKPDIRKAHIEEKAVLEKSGFEFSPYPGGSITDQYRGGGRNPNDVSDQMLNTEANYDHNTVQGIDMFKLARDPSTWANYEGHKLVHMVRNRDINSTNIESDSHYSSSKMMDRINLEKNQRLIEQHNTSSLTGKDEPMKDFIVAQQDHYIENVFHENSMLGFIIAQDDGFRYESNKNEGTKGSRAAAKGGMEAAAHFLNMVTGTRTIGFSEAFQHSNFSPNVFGGAQINESVSDLITAIKKQGDNGELHVKTDLLDQVRDMKLRGRKEEIVKQIAEESPSLKDLKERMEFGVAFTNFDKIWERASGQEFMVNKDDPQETLYVTDNRPTVKELNEFRDLSDNARDTRMNTPEGMLMFLEVETREAARFVYEANTGKKWDNMDELSTKEIREFVAENFLTPIQQDNINKAEAASDIAYMIRDNVQDSKLQKLAGNLSHAVVDSAIFPAPRVEHNHDKEIEVGRAA